jgi:aminomethyltransferase
MLQETVLNLAHREIGAKMVDFGGWDMPLRYGSQLDEHNAVRDGAGMFDVSHMTIIDLRGEKVRDFLKKLLANNVDKLTLKGKALYSCMLNEQGGIIDDLIVYLMGNDKYRLVVNAGTREKDLAWIEKQAESYSVEVRERPELAMIAVQGPKAREVTEELLHRGLDSRAKKLAPFQAAWAGEWFVARTGYTGEEGYELIMPGAEAVTFWKALSAKGVVPCGLAARDTLRLEAGMNLYGSDMDENFTPLESGLSWTVAFEPVERDFIGRSALFSQKEKGGIVKFVGLVLEDKGVLRNHQKIVVEGVGEGEISSGGFSPTMNRSIALARVPAGTGEQCGVDIRGKLKTAAVVKPCFVRNGKVLVNLD